MLLKQSQWLKPLLIYHNPVTVLPIITDNLLKQWKKEIKQQEIAIQHAQRNASNLLNQTNPAAPNTTETETHPQTVPDIPANCPVTDTPNIDSHPSLIDPEILLRDIALKYKFNEKQGIAFELAARTFITNNLAKQQGENLPHQEPLQLLLTGPGGTGKTHVVKGLREVMAAYGCEHKIWFFAPTGSAAALIDGMTIHKGLGIKINAKNKGKGN
jgi:chromosomal replication initiation ATPase DnaA